MSDILRAPAKINLILRIVDRRADGYHDIASLFAPVPGLCDDLRISAAPVGGGCVVSDQPDGCPPEKNLVFRAWRAYADATGFAPDVAVRLNKRIPTGMGLGGGSSDAAAMLRWLQAHAGKAVLATDALVELAARIGADVPFFLLGSPALAEGVGERLAPVHLDLSAFTLVLAMPRTRISTPWAYAAWDQAAGDENCGSGSSEDLTTKGTTNKRRVSLSPVVARNDFESVVFPVHPDLRALKERLLRLGAACAVMSGSGAGIASLFRDGRLAGDAADVLRRDGVSVHVETL